MKEKDYKYIIAILIIVIIGLFTFFYGSENNQIVSYLGFAGTITSLILSVVALIYTFYQSTTTVTQAQKLSETSTQLINAMDMLEHTQKQLAASIESFDFVSHQVAEVDNKVVNIMNSIKLPRSSSQTSIPEYSSDEMKRFIQFCSINGLITLFLCLYQYETPKDASLKLIFDDLHEYEDSFGYDYSYGFLIGFMSSGIMGISDPSENVRFTIPQYDIFKPLVFEVIDIYIEDEYVGKHIKKSIAAISAYYDNYNIWG